MTIIRRTLASLHHFLALHHLTSREKTILSHDLAVFLTALASTGIGYQVMGGGVSLASIVAAVTVAAKVTVRQVLPVPLSVQQFLDAGVPTAYLPTPAALSTATTPSTTSSPSPSSTSATPS